MRGARPGDGRQPLSNAEGALNQHQAQSRRNRECEEARGLSDMMTADRNRESRHQSIKAREREGRENKRSNDDEQSVAGHMHSPFSAWFVDPGRVQVTQRKPRGSDVGSDSIWQRGISNLGDRESVSADRSSLPDSDFGPAGRDSPDLCARSAPVAASEEVR